MKLPYITVGIDKYWHQLVFGVGVYLVGTGCIYWERLFSIGKAKPYYCIGEYTNTFLT